MCCRVRRGVRAGEPAEDGEELKLATVEEKQSEVRVIAGQERAADSQVRHNTC